MHLRNFVLAFFTNIVQHIQKTESIEATPQKRLYNSAYIDNYRRSWAESIRDYSP